MTTANQISRRRLVARGVLSGLVLAALTAIIMPAEKVSRAGIIIGGVIIWLEFFVVAGTIIASGLRSEQDREHGFAGLLARNLVAIAIGFPLLGWLLQLPFSRNIGPELAIFIVCAGVLLVMAVSRMRMH